MTKLPNGWTRATLGDLAGPDGLFCDGDWVETKDQDPDGEIRLLQLADVGVGRFRDRSRRWMSTTAFKRLNCTEVRAHDVLIARMPSPIGRACIVPELSYSAVTVVDVAILRAGIEGVNPRWLMWTMNSPQMHDEVAARATGTTRQRISRRNLSSISLPIPPRATQDTIAELLDIVDSAATRVEHELDHASIGIAKVEAHEHDRLVELSNVQQIPIADLLESARGGWSRGARHAVTEAEGRPYIKMGDLDLRGNILDDTIMHVVADSEMASKYEVKAGDILFNNKNSLELVGKIGLVKESLETAVFNENLTRLRFDEKLRPEYAVIYLTSPQFRVTLREIARASTNVAAIYHRDFSAQLIRVPSESEQIEIVGSFHESRDQAERIQQLIRSLRERVSAFRRATLRAAFDGSLTVTSEAAEPADALVARLRAGYGALSASKPRKARTEKAIS